MRYQCCCSDISLDEWKQLMKGARKCSYEKLSLDVPNPYAEQCKQTDTHYILVHSMIEYFIRK